MGIPFLTKHILPHADRVSFGRESKSSGLPCMPSVVIDGPSLVYHVYYRLLAWLDAPPTCKEVSKGVILCLQQLKDHEVQIRANGVSRHQICFDGALPLSKRDIRLSRLEKARQRLEICRQRPRPPYVNKGTETATIEPAFLWQGQEISSQWKDIPESPFMVPTVFNDLRQWWNGERIQAECDTFHHTETGFPWARLTVMVSGEADIACADISRRTGAAVLTNDSDMIIHDLGPCGAVVFLNTMYLVETHSDDSLSLAELRGSRIQPSSISGRLGISDIRRFAYELKRSPRGQFTDILRRSNEAADSGEIPREFMHFLQEYSPTDGGSSVGHRRLHPANLDPRLSELYWQYEQPELFRSPEGPHVYLGMLFEDHSRRCAWEQGRAYRGLGYSLLNLSQPQSHQCPVVHEFVRRGKRIVSEQITTASKESATDNIGLFRERIALTRASFGAVSASQFWVLFALLDVYCDSLGASMLPRSMHLQHFLQHGQLGCRLEWADVHLMAQVHAVLYSLRILKLCLHVYESQSGSPRWLCIFLRLPSATCPHGIVERYDRRIFQG
ncbi:hypothetical protein N7470_006730 [Penicillium chermesinum]|nr:hypothetical protein N7470_006730 [Penicillium chermesinum]